MHPVALAVGGESMGTRSLQAAKPITYADAGVDIRVADRMVESIRPFVKSTRRPGAESDIGGFAGLFDLKKAGFSDPLLVASNDGVGTKVKIAIETGVHHTIGIDLVAMCVNDLIVQGAEPLFFLDYFATGELNGQIGVEIVSGIAEGCRMAGAALIGGETAAMPGIYSGADYDLAGFVVGAVERGALLPRDDVSAGDVVLGLSSSGIHSNGFSLVRRIVAQTDLTWDSPAPFAKHMNLGAALLEPTKIYVKPLLAALKAGHPIKALAHITGGGLPDNIPRVLPDSMAAHIWSEKIPVQDVFRWLASTGPIQEPELLQTFNCGIGMVIVIERNAAAALSSFLTDRGERVTEIGEIKPLVADHVEFEGNLRLRSS